jgi:hypothetical protein
VVQGRKASQWLIGKAVTIDETRNKAVLSRQSQEALCDEPAQGFLCRMVPNVLPVAQIPDISVLQERIRVQVREAGFSINSYLPGKPELPSGPRLS